MAEPGLSIEAQRFEYRRAERNRRAAAVERALARHHFEDRYQIAEPMEPTCQLCIVVPSYGEHVGIIPLLVSMARQQRIRPEQFEVIVVINNSAAEASDQTLAYHSNQNTLHLLKALEAKQFTPIHKAGRIFQPGDVEYDWLKQYFDEITAANLRLRHLDLSSVGQAQPMNNVGLARDLGGWEAVRRFHANQELDGLIFMTDADCAFKATTLADTTAAFWKSHIDHEGGSGGRDVYYERPEAKDLETTLLYRTDFASDAVITAVDNCLHPADIPSLSAKDFFAGAHMVARMDAYALSGGIPHVSGGEDTYFGVRLTQLGYTGFLPTSLYTLFRPSQRTDAAHGFGWTVSRAQERMASEQPKIKSLAYRLAVKQCRTAIDSGLSFTEFSAQQSELATTIGQTVYDRMVQLSSIDPRATDYAQAAHQLQRCYRIELRAILEPVFPDEPVGETVTALEHYVAAQLPDLWSAISAIRNDQRQRYDVLRAGALAHYQGAEAIFTSLTSEQQGWVRERSLTKRSIIILAEAILAYWKHHAGQVGATADFFAEQYIVSPKGFVSALLVDAWHNSNQCGADQNQLLLHEALSHSEPRLLPDTPLRSYHAQLYSLEQALHQQAAQLRHSHVEQHKHPKLKHD